MNYLLDTHVFLWMLAAPDLLSAKARAVIQNPDRSIYVSAVTAGEIAIKDAISFSSALLEQSHVAVVPGNDSGFDTHIRLSFATSMEQIDKGLDRVARFLAELK